MILQALHAYYQRLLQRGEETLSALGYTQEKISYVLVLASDGKIVDVQENLDYNGKKPFPKLISVPASFKRPGISPKSFFLWDKTSYVFGVGSDGKAGVLRTPKAHESFVHSHRRALSGESDGGLKALLSFIADWIPDHFRLPHFRPEMLDTNFAFRLDGERQLIHESPNAQRIWTKLQAEAEATEGICLVTGQVAPLARLHPAIKGVAGAQAVGASIVSFNLESFTSYGKSQGDNAPVSEQAAFAYTTVLNHLLRRGEHNRQRLQIGDTTVVFWAEAAEAGQAEAAESLFADMWDSPTDAQESNLVRLALERIRTALPLGDLDPRLDEGTRMYVLGLAPNASRISIRFWYTDTLGHLARHVAFHAQDLRIEPAPWKVMPALWRLMLATAPSRDGRASSDDVPPQLAGEWMRAILSGNRYPGSLLANLIMRMRSDGDLSGVRVAICKAVLERNRRLNTNVQNEEVPVSLDKQSRHPGYRLGRLFAVLEAAQRGALGGQVNATIRDRYYGAASATPASVFPMLLRNTQNHLGKLRKEKPGLAVLLEKDIREIVDGLSDQFPRSLRIEDQGRFAIGYYHQSQSRFNKSEADDNDSNADTTEETAA